MAIFFVLVFEISNKPHYFVIQSAFMDPQHPNLDTLREIRQIMDRSSRFISLSGWSGVVAGLSALAGAWWAHDMIDRYYRESYGTPSACPACLKQDLILVAAAVFLVAFSGAVLFTYRKSRRDGIPFWGVSAKRLMWNTVLPMAVGAVFIWRLMELRQYELVAPASLLFYGLALVNGSRFTLGEVRYLGYAIILTGLVNLWFPGSGLYFWAFGFGVLHITYGLAMWWRYDRQPDSAATGRAS
jgi:hypothetical protein